MKKNWFLILVAACVFCLLAAPTADAAGPEVLNIDSLLSSNLLGDEDQLRTDKVGGDSLSSVHLTQVRGPVEAHRHDEHHEIVYIVRGAGRLTLDGVRHKVSAGTVISIPPGTSHSYYSQGKVPTVVVSVFSPAFDGKTGYMRTPRANRCISSLGNWTTRMRRIIGQTLLIVTLVVGATPTANAQTRLNLTRTRTETTPANPSQFTVARLHYPGGGDWYWGSSALPNLLTFLRDEAGIPALEEEVRVKPIDDELFNYPFIYSTGHGNMRFSDDGIIRLRRYLTGGGFWLINDSYGMDKSVRRELKRIFPDRELVELPFSHELYHAPFEFPDGPPKIHEHDNKPAQGYAILDGERVVVFYVVECDIGDGWEDPQVHKDPPEKRLAALKMGANIAVYALTN